MFCNIHNDNKEYSVSCAIEYKADASRTNVHSFEFIPGFTFGPPCSYPRCCKLPPAHDRKRRRRRMINQQKFTTPFLASWAFRSVSIFTTIPASITLRSARPAIISASALGQQLSQPPFHWQFCAFTTTIFPACCSSTFYGWTSLACPVRCGVGDILVPARLSIVISTVILNNFFVRQAFNILRKLFTF